jgi:DHA2 family multidrug resistance protein
LIEQPALPTPARRLAIIVTVMAAAQMVVLDTTIANVALPHMQAALGATPESIAWVLTSYIVAAAVATPITGWLEAQLSRRVLFIGSTAIFTASSALCGFAGTLELMVLARVIQGISGAFLIPLSQSILLDCSPPDKRAQAMSILMVGMIIGPIMGPVVGGWITDHIDWRWIFFINVPIGGVAVITSLMIIDNAPMEKRPFDIAGFLLLAIGLACFQLMLDRGTHLDWFDSAEIVIEAGLAIACIWMFVIHSTVAKTPLIPIAIYRDRNLMVACLFQFLSAGVVFGGAALMTTMLQTIMGFDTTDAGMMMMPRASASLIGLFLVGRYGNRADLRYFITCGVIIASCGLWMMSGFNLQMDKTLMITSGFVLGCGVGLMTMPLNVLAFETLTTQLRTEGAAFLSLARNLGGSVVISYLTATIARNSQTGHADLAEHITLQSTPMLDERVIGMLARDGSAVAMMVNHEITRQALMIAYVDAFWLMMWATIATLPALLLLRRKPKNAQQQDLPPPVME